MKPLATVAYWSATLVIFLSPLVGILLGQRPSPLQTWAMYASAYPACTIQFSDPEGVDPDFHFATIRLMNQELDRPIDNRMFIRTEQGAEKLLDGYCYFPLTKHRRAKVNLQCFEKGEWKTSARSGILACKD